MYTAQTKNWQRWLARTIYLLFGPLPSSDIANVGVPARSPLYLPSMYWRYSIVLGEMTVFSTPAYSIPAYYSSIRIRSRMKKQNKPNL